VLAGAISFVAALVLSEALGLLVYRPRPFVALDFPPLFPWARDSSFPSDHALLGAALAWPIGWISLRRCLVLLLWVLIVGFARVMAGVHYPTDVLASLALALVTALFGLIVAAYLVSRVPALRRLVYSSR
jgi:undecaprenyl-diphosphatase